MWRRLMRLQRLTHLLWLSVLIHGGAIRRDKVIGSRVLLRRLRERRTAVFGRRCIVRYGLVTSWGGLLIVRLLLLLVVLVTILLIHLHCRLVLVAVVMERLGLVRLVGLMGLVRLVRLVGKRSLRGLHHATGWRRSVLALVMWLVLVLAGRVRRHLLSVGSGLRRRQLLVTVGRLVRLRHIVHAWTANGRQRVVAGIGG